MASTALTKAIKRVVNNQSETKQVAWYSGPLQNGTFANASYVNHNAQISSNVSDILRLIPYINQGTADNQRIGETIVPKSLVVNGSVRLSDGTLNDVVAGFRDDIVVVLYVLQHVSLKTYTSLASLNNFTQLLRTSENTTAAFTGRVVDSQLPVEDQYYRLLSKKKLRLRYAGAIPGSATGVPVNSVVSVSNSHSYYADFNFNLSKHLPAKLKYPEQVTGGPVLPGAIDPTNSSIFMAVGFYNMDGTPTPADQLMSIQWSSFLKYKDT